MRQDISQNVAHLAVLMISPQFHPLVGGYERAAERLSVALAQRGLRIVVITERRDRRWSAVEFVDGYEIRRLSCWYRRHFHALTSLLSFAGYLLWRGRDFAVWHVHQYGLHAALAVALGRLLGRPVVLKLTNSGSMGIERAMGKGLAGWILADLHRRVNACLALSEETREEAIRFGIPQQRVHLIPNGVDGRQFHPVSAEERGTAQRALGLNCQRLVLYVGRLSPEKNPLGLLDAWAAIEPDMRANTLLALVGDGPERNQVDAKVAELNLSESVYLAGQQSDMATWYQAADVYVMASHNEGLSNTMIEAMATGLPIVATRVSGSSILLELPAAGLVVDVGDMKRLAAAMALLLQDEPMRTQFGKNARQAFETHFSLDSLASCILSLYAQLLAIRTLPGNP